ncbi:hypothetical protein DIPPA_34135 [Diplonema papillatum]|nr:hypothetical protein DIPPA_34135 [Diplonema papillatum]
MPTVRRGSAVPYHPPTPRCLPEHMWVTCPEMPEAAGRFTLLMEKRNEMPAWKGGKRYLYCNVGGGWMLASDYEHMQSNRGWIASARLHNGLLCRTSTPLGPQTR